MIRRHLDLSEELVLSPSRGLERRRDLYGGAKGLGHWARVRVSFGDGSTRGTVNVLVVVQPFGREQLKVRGCPEIGVDDGGVAIPDGMEVDEKSSLMWVLR